MGLTPLGGLVMGTRPGDLDPGVVLALLRDGLDLAAISALLHHHSGLAGVSGRSSDVRDLEAAAGGDPRAQLALDVFAHSVRKTLGAYAAVLGGLDAVVLTGGIGENAVAMRARILGNFDFLGLTVDADHNARALVSDTAPVATISAPGSRVAALVVKTNEELAIAQETARVVSGA
jgi:acetate kinase